MPVVDRSGSRSRSAVSVSILVAALMALFAEQAFAQGLFDLFSNARRELAAPALSYAPAAPAAAPPSIERPRPSNGTGHSVNYCVRLCDGRYFPIQRHAAVSPVQLCDALCPSSRTKIFSGRDAAHAVATDGTRYGSLQNAFLYRKQLVPGCTCNGKDYFGLAKMDPNVDPTSRPGDVLVTAGGRTAGTDAKSIRAASN
jgi:hypothetical protein